jgi:hypothetical protein
MAVVDVDSEMQRLRVDHGVAAVRYPPSPAPKASPCQAWSSAKLVRTSVVFSEAYGIVPLCVLCLADVAVLVLDYAGKRAAAARVRAVRAVRSRQGREARSRFSNATL